MSDLVLNNTLFGSYKGNQDVEDILYLLKIKEGIDINIDEVLSYFPLADLFYKDRGYLNIDILKDDESFEYCDEIIFYYNKLEHNSYFSNKILNIDGVKIYIVNIVNWIKKMFNYNGESSRLSLTDYLVYVYLVNNDLGNDILNNLKEIDLDELIDKDRILILNEFKNLLEYKFLDKNIVINGKEFYELYFLLELQDSMYDYTNIKGNNFMTNYDKIKSLYDYVYHLKNEQMKGNSLLTYDYVPLATCRNCDNYPFDITSLNSYIHEFIRRNEFGKDIRKLYSIRFTDNSSDIRQQLDNIINQIKEIYEASII